MQRFFLRAVFLLIFLLMSCSDRKQDFIALKDDFENIFVECKDADFTYTKDDLIKIRSDMRKILKQEGKKW